MVSDDAGRRSADGTFEWTQGEIEGKPLVIRHRAPDVTSHLYPSGDIDEPILLYRGRFCTQADAPAEHAYDGDIRLSWLPTPRIEARGERDSTPGDVETLLNEMSATEIWQLIPQIYLPDTTGIPPAPSEEAPPRSSRAGTLSVGPMAVYPAEIGDGSAHPGHRSHP